MSRHGTPLRYPGGKQKLTPFIREILSANELAGANYVEPYAGGAGVAVELLLAGDVSKIHLNDSCAKIHAIWWAILNEPDAFCRKIRNASLNVDEWRRQQAIMKTGDNTDRLQLGFSAFYLNRVNRSGILTGGLIGGLAQNGTWNMDARFPRNELIRRIELIASKKKSIAIRNWDAERFISDYIPRVGDRSLVYFDPPYYRKAERLYLNHYSPGDHIRLAAAIQERVNVPWLVSYDGAAEIQELYKERRSFLYSLQYNAGRCYQGLEFFAFSDKLIVPASSSLDFINKSLTTMN
jgi:DNA adenine methylase